MPAPAWGTAPEQLKLEQTHSWEQVTGKALGCRGWRQPCLDNLVVKFLPSSPAILLPHIVPHLVETVGSHLWYPTISSFILFLPRDV